VRPMKLGIIGVVVFIAAYVGSIVLYANSGVSHPDELTEGPPSGGAATVIVDVEEVQSGNSLLIANYTVTPGPELLDPVTQNLKEALGVVVTSVVKASKRTGLKGTLPDVFRVSLPLLGEVGNWPFDRYESGPVTANLLSGAAPEPVPHTVIMVDRLLGW